MAASDAFYQELLIDVAEVIDEVGTEYEIRSHEPYDPLTLTQNEEVSTRVVKGIVSDQLDGLVAEDTRANWAGHKALILTHDALPEPTEEVLVNGSWYPFTEVEEIKPADVICLYILKVKG